LLLVTGLILQAACDSATPTAIPDPGVPDPAPATDVELISAEAWHAGHRGISPMRLYAQNVYVGTDVDGVIAAGATSSDPTVLFGAILSVCRRTAPSAASSRPDRPERAGSPA
jgi:hypothetical protein